MSTQPSARRGDDEFFSIAKWVTLYIPLIVGLFGLYYLWARNGKSILRLTVTVAFTFVCAWLLWRVLLRYLGTPEGRQISWDSLIFVGAIGGFLTSGIIGLFVGSVVLVLAYKLVLAWLYGEEADAGGAAGAAPGVGAGGGESGPCPQPRD